MVFVVAQAYSLCLVYIMWFACLETGVCSCLAFAAAVRLFCNCQASSLGLLSIMRHDSCPASRWPLVPPKKHGFMSIFHASRLKVHGTYKQVSLEAAG